MASGGDGGGRSTECNRRSQTSVGTQRVCAAGRMGLCRCGDARRSTCITLWCACRWEECQRGGVCSECARRSHGSSTIAPRRRPTTTGLQHATPFSRTQRSVPPHQRGRDDCLRATHELEGCATIPRFPNGVCDDFVQITQITAVLITYCFALAKDFCEQ